MVFRWNESFEYEDHAGIWNSELRDWVPDRIFDAHVHLGPPNSMRPFSPERLQSALSTFPGLTYETANHIYHGIYNGKEVAGLIAFGFPLMEVDLEQANAYIADTMLRAPRIKGFIVADPTNAQKTIAAFRRAEERGARFSGVKPYYDLTGKQVFDTHMREFIPDDLLSFMNEEALAMMLHTSRSGMGVPECQEYVREVAWTYPRIRIILAHMGRYIDYQEFFRFMETDIMDFPNVYLEMSSASRMEVYERALDRRELWPRILFGSDIPFGLITGTEIWSEKYGPIFLTRDEYTWTDKELSAALAEVIPSLSYNTYHTIKALKEGITALRLPADEQEKLKRMIFYDNAVNGLFGGQLRNG